MSEDFKSRHFPGEVIPWAVRWYCRYAASYRNLEDVLAERGLAAYHATTCCEVRAHALEIEERLRWHWKRPSRWHALRVD